MSDSGSRHLAPRGGLGPARAPFAPLGDIARPGALEGSRAAPGAPAPGGSGGAADGCCCRCCRARRHSRFARARRPLRGALLAGQLSLQRGDVDQNTLRVVRQQPCLRHTLVEGDPGGLGNLADPLPERARHQLGVLGACAQVLDGAEGVHERDQLLVVAVGQQSREAIMLAHHLLGGARLRVDGVGAEVAQHPYGKGADFCVIVTDELDQVCDNACRAHVSTERRRPLALCRIDELG
eukprot:scaffold20885_cov58-Phaeocystis_antarctica.AAC.7